MDDEGARDRETRLAEAIEQRPADLVDRLASAVTDPSQEVRSTAAYGLEVAGGERAIPTLIRMVDQDQSESVVDHALKSLESYRGDDVLGCLLREADRRRRSRPPRRHVANQLGSYDDRRSIDTLVNLLHDSDASVQQAAFESLVRLRPAELRRWEKLLAGSSSPGQG